MTPEEIREGLTRHREIQLDSGEQALKIDIEVAKLEALLLIVEGLKDIDRSLVIISDTINRG